MGREYEDKAGCIWHRYSLDAPYPHINLPWLQVLLIGLDNASLPPPVA